MTVGVIAVTNLFTRTLESSLCHSVLSVPCSLLLTCWERADIFALSYVIFCVFLTLSNMVSWVWCGI